MKVNKFIIEKTKTGYSAYSDDKPVYTTGQTIHELHINALEALNLYFEEFGKTTTLKSIELELDFKQFFDFYKIINAKHLARRIGMNESLLSQYVNGIKKPSKKQVSRSVQGLHEIGRELLELTLV